VSGFSVEILTQEQAVYLYEMAMLSHLYTGYSQWWIGLSDFYHEGVWQWVQSSTTADLSIYTDFFVPDNATSSDDCVIMTITQDKLEWEDVSCMATLYKDDNILPICQCKGEDCLKEPPTVSTDPPTPGLVCQDNWVEAGAMGCIQFLPDNAGVSMEEASELCAMNSGFLVESRTNDAIVTLSTLANMLHSYNSDVESWWIGLTRLDESSWAWAQSRSGIEHSNWGKNQPNGTEEANCVVLTRDSKGDYRWDDIDCDMEEYNGRGIATICQECRPGDGCGQTTTTDASDTTIMSSYTTSETMITTTTSLPWPENCIESTDSSACYLLVSSKASWESAEADCASKGGHLVSSLSEEENNFLGSSIVKFENVWLGGALSGLSWAWSDSQPWEYEVWKTGEPSEGDCVYYHWDTSKWSSYQCSLHLRYVCKFI